METRILSGNEINAAQQLLYEVFVVEQKWQVPDNPTQIRVEAGKLLDAYDAIATWFGIFEGDHLVGCHRVCGELCSTFELEHYHALPDFIKCSKQAVEGTRLAIDKAYRSSTAFYDLIQFEWQYLLHQGCQYFFTTAAYPRPGALYVRRFYLKKYGNPFRYHFTDLNEVYLYFIDRQGMQQFVDKSKNHG